MSESWYTAVTAQTPLTQGDLIFDCPVVTWKAGPITLDDANESEVLLGATTAMRADVIVMTQACDLEHNKVANIILCTHLSLSDYRPCLEEEMKAAQQNLTEKAWRSFCNDMRDGFIWNLAILNAHDTEKLSTEHRIVDFHEVFTVPRTFLESYLTQRGTRRLRLLPPYREHVSQAFARFFMRVGLPTPVETAW